jgi:hypothetical protein
MSLDKVSTARRVVFGSGVLLLIFSFLAWNSAGGCVSSPLGKFCASASINGWHSWGTAMGIFLIILLAWEGLLLLLVVSPGAVKLPELPVKPIMISLGLGALTVLFGVIRVFQYGSKTWELWVSLLLMIALAAGLFLRLQDEGGVAAAK